MRVLPVCVGLGLLFALTTEGPAQETERSATKQQAPRLDRVVITGNQRVEEEAIRVQIRSQPGTRLDEETVDADIRALYRMGFFDTVEADLSEQNGRWVLTYRVAERPLIKELHIEGNKKIGREELEPALKVRPNTILDPEKVQKGIDEAKKL